MKRLASVLGALIILAAAIVPAGATAGDGLPSADAGSQQIAFANWLVHEDGELFLYFAAGTNTIPNEMDYSFGMIGRAPCRHVERNGRKMLRCSGSARRHALLPGEFVVDPALNSATLTMEARDEVHSISWEGKGALAEPYWHQHSGPGVNAMAMIMAWRRSKASGSVFGRSLSGGRAVMLEMVTADAWIALPIAAVTGTQIRFVDGLLKVRADL